MTSPSVFTFIPSPPTIIKSKPPIKSHPTFHLMINLNMSHYTTKSLFHVDFKESSHISTVCKCIVCVLCPHLELVVCVNILLHCIPRNLLYCILSPAGRTHCPSPACQSQHRSRSPPPTSAIPSEQQPTPRGDLLLPRPRAPPRGAGTPRRNARQDWSPEASANTERAGRTLEFAGCRSRVREGLKGNIKVRMGCLGTFK